MYDKQRSRWRAARHPLDLSRAGAMSESVELGGKRTGVGCWCRPDRGVGEGDASGPVAWSTGQGKPERRWWITPRGSGGDEGGGDGCEACGRG
jgi:hypothetical protein